MMPNIECVYCGLPVPGVRDVDSANLGPQYCCYGCRLAARVTGSAGEEGHARLTLTLLGVAVFLSMNVMVFNWMLYGQEVYNPGGAVQSSLGQTTIAIFRYLSMLFATPVLAILGWPILRNAAENLRHRRVNTDLLIVIGVAAAFLLSYASVMRDRGAVYFDTVCMVLVLVTVGRYLEAGAKVKTTAALRALDTLLPAEVLVERDGHQQSAPLAVVQRGDRVVVKPGSRIPVDGCVAEGESHVDEQVITGESQPRSKQAGERVHAGSLNGDGALRISVTAVGADTVLAGVVRLLQAAGRDKSRYERIADRVAGVFVPLVALIALSAAAVAWKKNGAEDAILRALAVLLISCPCALGLATPMAVWVGLGRAARRAVLFRRAAALELLSGVRTICFDKTGTLTTGSPTVAECQISEAADVAPGDVIASAAGLAASTTHHLGAAIVAFAGQKNLHPITVRSVSIFGGKGVSGQHAESGARLLLGSPKWLAEAGQEMDETLSRTAEALIADGRSLACVAWNGHVRGVFGFDEQLRPEAPAAIAALERRRIALRMLTGDHQRRAEMLGANLNIRADAELLPADKIDVVRRLSASNGPVAMVGDGINDAPALAAADVGIAMGCGADITRESGDICLATDDLNALVWAIDLSSRTVRVIRQNLVWAFGYNAVGIGLAATGRLSPIFAALAMVASSTLVVANSLRLNRVTISGEPRPVQPLGAPVRLIRK